MTTTGTEPDTWYWCMKHSQVERGADSTCPPDDRLGPYESEEAAKNWRQRVDARNEKWEDDDKKWSGDDT